MPGISVSKIPIPFNKGGGISWSSYWATRTPASLVATEISDSRIDLAWTDGADAADGLRIYYSTDNETFTEHGTANYGDEAYSAIGLTDGTVYYFRVVAYKGTNESDPISDDACTIPTKFLGATVKYWFDFTDSSLKTVSEGRVSQVNDKSANAFHITMASASYKPYDLESNGIQGQGGQRLQNLTALDSAGSNTIFMVARIDTFEAGKTFLDLAVQTYLDGTTPKIKVINSNPIYIDAPSDEKWFLLTSVIDDAGTDTVQINNGTPVTATNGSNQNPINSVLGKQNSSEHIQASIKMAILIHEVLSGTDLTKAQTYLNWKYKVFF